MVDHIGLLVFFVLLIIAGAYPIGMLFSAGYHKQKLKFLSRMRREHCGEV